MIYYTLILGILIGTILVICYELRKLKNDTCFYLDKRLREIEPNYIRIEHLQEWRKSDIESYNKIEQKINQLECDHPEDAIAYEQNSYTLTKSCNKCNKILKLYRFSDESYEYKKDKAAHELKIAQKNHDEVFGKKDKKCTK